MIRRPVLLYVAMFTMTVLSLAIYASSGGIGRTIEVDEASAIASRRQLQRGLYPAYPTPVSLNQTAPAIVERAPTITPAPVADRFETSDIGVAERLAIKFHGYPDLSGEYRIRSDGTLSIPVIGRINIASMTDNDIEVALAQRLARTTGRDTFVTVEISEYRSVFITGFVSKPGSFPWRPGMNVLQAVALAGGTFRTSGEQGGAAVGEDGAIIRLQKAINEQKRNLAALARLRAEQTVAPGIEVPEKLVALVGKREAESMVAAEATSFTSRRAALEAKRAALTRAVQMAEKELAGLNEQARRLKVQLQMRRDYKSNIDRLQSKGIVRTERLMDENTRVSDLEDRETGLNVSMARVHVMLASLERDRVNLEHERKAEIDSEIIRLERSIGQLDIEITGARSAYVKMTGQEPPASLLLADAPRKLTVKYEIVRPSAATATTTTADQLMAVRPGDTLVVSVD